MSNPYEYGSRLAKRWDSWWLRIRWGFSMTRPHRSHPFSSWHCPSMYFLKAFLFESNVNIEVWLYAISQFLLFLGNLIEHMSGYLGPPNLDTMGLVNNMMLASAIHRSWWLQSQSYSGKADETKLGSTPEHIIGRYYLSPSATAPQWCYWCLMSDHAWDPL